MRFIIRTVMLIALVWIGLLLSGYGVLIGLTDCPLLRKSNIVVDNG